MHTAQYGLKYVQYGLKSESNCGHYKYFVLWSSKLYIKQSSAWPSRILTRHRNETRSLAIADLIWYSAGE